MVEQQRTNIQQITNDLIDRAPEYGIADRGVAQIAILRVNGHIRAAQRGFVALQRAGQLGDHHRLHSVRAHLLEQAGDNGAAVNEFQAAAARTTNLRERDYLVTKAARLAAGPP